MKKVLDWLVPAMVTALLAWAIWITTSIYAGDKESAIATEKVGAICDKIKRIEDDVKEIKKDMKDQNEKVQNNQTEVMRMLMDIKKNTKEAK